MGYFITIILFLMAVFATAFLLMAKDVRAENKNLSLLYIGWSLLIWQNIFATSVCLCPILYQTFLLKIPMNVIYAGSIISSVLEIAVVFKIIKTKEMLQGKWLTETIFLFLAFIAGCVASAYILTAAPTL